MTPPAAIANAVHDACGVRIFDTPVTAEKVYAALRGKAMRLEARGVSTTWEIAEGL